MQSGRNWPCVARFRATANIKRAFISPNGQQLQKNENTKIDMSTSLYIDLSDSIYKDMGKLMSIFL